MRITERDIENKINVICDFMNEITKGTRRGTKGHYHMSWNGHVAFSREGSTGEEIVTYIHGNTRRDRYDSACGIIDTLIAVKECI